MVLSAGVPTRVPDVPDEVLTAWHETRRTLHAELSGDSDLRVVDGADHDIHREDPDAVIAAIRDVVEAVRQDGRVSDRGDPD